MHKRPVLVVTAAAVMIHHYHPPSSTGVSLVAVWGGVTIPLGYCFFSLPANVSTESNRLSV